MPARPLAAPRPVAVLLVSLLGAAVLAGCGSSDASSSAPTTTEATTTTSPGGASTTTTASSGPSVDPTRLPVGDGKYSTEPKAGYVFTCQTQFGGGGAMQEGPWFNGDGTWDSTKKGVVDGEVSWPNVLTTSVDGDDRRFSGNDLPDHVTGVFPVSPDDEDVYPYDRNPNSISEQTLEVTVPANPEIADEPTCIRGELGVMLTGSALFSAFDAGGRDAVAWEAQDSCSGHPQEHGAYHYHSLTSCIDDPGTGQSNLLGYAYDGFGIYGMRGADGQELTNEDLDECHGTTSEVMWDGKLVEMYHYVATREFPYVMGCFKGTPIQNQFSG